MARSRSGSRSLLAGAALTCLVLAGCGGSVAAPTTFTPYNAKDGTFQCPAPDGWEVSGGGKRGPVWAKFEQGSALIRLNGDVSGSLMADIAGGRQSELNETDSDFSPVAGVHEFGKMEAEQNIQGYEEQGAAITVPCPLGPARRSEFTGSTSFGGNVRGYRQTVLARDKRVVVTCSCRESDWVNLRPAFEHVLKNIKVGQKQ